MITIVNSANDKNFMLYRVYADQRNGIDDCMKSIFN